MLVLFATFVARNRELELVLAKLRESRNCGVNASAAKREPGRAQEAEGRRPTVTAEGRR
jgi:hypothetical protein